MPKVAHFDAIGVERRTPIAQKCKFGDVWHILRRNGTKAECTPLAVRSWLATLAEGDFAIIAIEPENMDIRSGPAIRTTEGGPIIRALEETRQLPDCVNYGSSFINSNYCHLPVERGPWLAANGVMRAVTGRNTFCFDHYFDDRVDERHWRASAEVCIETADAWGRVVLLWSWRTVQGRLMEPEEYESRTRFLLRLLDNGRSNCMAHWERFHDMDGATPLVWNEDDPLVRIARRITGVKA